MPEMHILVLPSWYPETPNDINGCFFREQALALRKHGHKVTVIYPQLHSLRRLKVAMAAPWSIEKEIDNEMPTYRSHGIAWFPRIPHANLWLWLRRGMKLFAHYVEEHGLPELIHVHSMLNAGPLARAIRTQYHIPYVVTEHSTAFARNLIRPWQIPLMQGVAHSAARRLAVSPPFCDLLENLLGTSCGNWQAMPNIVERTFTDAPLHVSRRPDSDFIFVNVALLTKKKGIHNLISAFAQAFGDDKSVILKIGGEGTERRRLKELAAELRVADRVHFLGALTRQQVAEQMASADAFVLPSLHETFGVVVIEALALGKPVIATRCGGPESIVRKEDGLLVPPDDPLALASAMRSLKANHPMYRPQGIRAACISRFSEEAIAARLTQIYSEVLADHC